MMACVSDLGTTWEAFPMTNGTKQACVIGSTAILYHLQRLKARTKVSLMLLRKLLFANDCTLISHTKDELQSRITLWRHYQYNKNPSDASVETM